MGEKSQIYIFEHQLERVGDIRSNPEYIVLKKMLYTAIAQAVDNLSYRDNRIVLDYCGLKRFRDWLKSAKLISKEQLAAYIHVGKIQAVDNNFRRAISTIRVKLKRQGWILKNTTIPAVVFN